jgi:hypothetical protein
MPTVTIQATACEFSSSSTGFRCTRFMMLEMGKFAREDHTVTKASEVRPLADALRARLEVEHPAQSFFISHRLRDGDRAPSGYRKLPHTLLEVDRDTPAAVAA